MSPGSSAGITSFSFTVPASQSVPHNSTMLMHLIKTWLIDKVSLRLIFTSRRMSHEIQHYYRLRLRPNLAPFAASPIAIYHIYRSLGQTHITPLYRGILVTHLRQSGRLPDMVKELKKTPPGRELVAVLHLEQSL